MLRHPNLTRTQVIGRECCDTQISQEVFFIHIKCEIWAATTVLSVFFYIKALKCKEFQIIRCLIKPLLKNSTQTIFQGGTP